jgi:hypothetical protein
MSEDEQLLKSNEQTTISPSDIVSQFRSWLREQRHLSADASFLGHIPNRNLQGNRAEPTDTIFRIFSHNLCPSLLHLHVPTFRTFRTLNIAQLARAFRRKFFLLIVYLRLTEIQVHILK